MPVKTITVRLPQTTYERLLQLAEVSEELPSETARGILKEFLANWNIAQMDELPENQPGYSGPIIGREADGRPIVRGRILKPGEGEDLPHVKVRIHKGP